MALSPNSTSMLGGVGSAELPPLVGNISPWRVALAPLLDKLSPERLQALRKNAARKLGFLSPPAHGAQALEVVKKEKEVVKGEGKAANGDVYKLHPASQLPGLLWPGVTRNLS